MNHEWLPQLWTTIPFIGLLLSIALLPLVASKFWHHLKNQALVVALFSVPVIYLCLANNPHLLYTGLEHYVSFVILLGSLFIISGGICITGDLTSTPLANTLMLGAGAVLANFIGTTGASMVLIRPLLHANNHRKHHVHIPIFFIMAVSNIGGLLTPLGDPPLFLGFLLGVPFFWTLRLTPAWVIALAILLAVFYAVDHWAFDHETRKQQTKARSDAPVTLRGLRNLSCLAAIIAATLYLQAPYREIVMVLAALFSLKITPKSYHQANGFNFDPILEVAILFLGIFITMQPALEILYLRGAELGIKQPWQFFWATGMFSSFLDNAPTYLTFISLAQGLGLSGPYLNIPEKLLAAISIGSVFFGAMTYIGNAPNFMVRSIAHQRGWKMPSFFGYMAWSAAILLPLFLLVTLIFFR
ncbi:MAG TPA: sodium:proton antiporter [Candidatus Omnitrophota bacterium]|nr:sodium:proton antiporter [Candidatus Omnitrophota bacterium]